MNMWVKASCSILLALLVLGGARANAVTLAELSARPALTPEQFAAYFKDFEFVFHAEIQDPQVFLSTRSGDCDDYATLAATILREKGYTPRLIAVRMPGIVHVVCYIEESGAYLDYNRRHCRSQMIKSVDSLPEIARKVAKSFGAPWASASEFTFNGQAKMLVATVFENKSPLLALHETSFASSQSRAFMQ